MLNRYQLLQQNMLQLMLPMLVQYMKILQKEQLN
jgi:hypothetical protein